MDLKVIPQKVTLFTTEATLKEQLRFCERAGRNCYGSTDRIKENSYVDFLHGQIVRLGHYSVLRHAQVSFELVASIATLRQLMRHATGTVFHQSSTRYQNFTKDKFKNTLFIVSEDPHPIQLKSWQQSAEAYESLLQEGLKAEDARSVLPLETASTLCITLNLQALRHIWLERGTNTHAQKEVRELVQDMVNTLPPFVQQLVTYGEEH